MNKLLALAAVGVLSVATAAHAETKHETTTHETTTHSTVAVEAKEAMLKDGTKVSVEGESVFVVDAKGAKTPAPDATHEMADGTKVTTMNGKIVADEDHTMPVKAAH